MSGERMPWVPQRGDLVLILLEPQTQPEHAWRSPALVLSPARYNDRTGLAVVCPTAAVARGYPFEVPIPDGLPLFGAVLADQVRSLDWRMRQAELACRLPERVVLEVLQKLGTLVAP